MDLRNDEQLYIGTRGKDFKKMIRNLLERGRLQDKYIKLLMDDEGMVIYNDAFTAPSANQDVNYEVYEQLGDVTVNKFIVWYMYRRFPQLNCPGGVKIVARLKINYGSKQSFSDIAEKLGFWDFISASDEDRGRKKKPLLEDSFESFVGATEFILDHKIRNGVGYAIVYDILTSIFDSMDISLRYEDLYDAKTRLKELFDTFKINIGNLEYKEEKIDSISKSIAYQVKDDNGRKVYIKLGEGSAALKADSQQRAAINALDTLRRNGYEKPVPDIYKYFCT